jgi:hypothetical protein
VQRDGGILSAALAVSRVVRLTAHTRL